MSNKPSDWDLYSLKNRKLDEEWENQPDVFHDYVVQLTEAKATHERAKARRDVIIAELDAKIRKDPKSFGLKPSPTKDAIDRTIMLQQDRQDIEEKVIETKRQVGLLVAMVRALEHRKRALEELTGLDGRDYRAPPLHRNGFRKREPEREMDKLFE